MTVRWTQLPPITLLMLTAVLLYVIVSAAWLLGTVWHSLWRFPVATLLLAALGACVGLAFALASSRRPYCEVPPTADQAADSTLDPQK